MNITKIKIFFYFVSLVSVGCKSRLNYDSKVEMKNYIDNEKNGLTHSVIVEPFFVNLQYLPQNYINLIYNSNSKVNTFNHTSNFQLRVTNGEKAPLLQQLANCAPASWSTSERTRMITYGFEQAASLHIGQSIVKPLFATVEMTAQMQKELRVMLVFPTEIAQLQKNRKAEIVLSPYFFKKPLRLEFDTENMLAVIPTN